VTLTRDERLPAWATVTPGRLAHLERVAALVDGWARRMRVPDSDRRRWLRAVWLHDALRDAPPATLARWAPDALGPPELRHGPAGAACAEAHGEQDRSVLDAVRYHSVGHAGWEMPGRVLYCADYLEPGRPFDRERRSELAARFPDDPAGVLAAVTADRVAYTVRSGWPLLQPTVDLWNSLAASSGSR
jgi:HD superfamily phosphohydrolase YqeK